MSCSAMNSRSSSVAHALEFAGFPAFNLLHVKALELSAQFFSPDCSARLSPLIGSVAQLTQLLHVQVQSKNGCSALLSSELGIHV
jgi:hypothetical protein